MPSDVIQYGEHTAPSCNVFLPKEINKPESHQASGETLRGKNRNSINCMEANKLECGTWYRMGAVAMKPRAMNRQREKLAWYKQTLKS